MAGVLLCSSLVAQDYPFASDIRKFRADDKISPPPGGSVLFIGSSSFTLWKDVQDCFPGFKIINRGFGGSQLTDQIRYVYDIVFPYNPCQIIIYCGENDFAASDTITPVIVTGRFAELFSIIRSKLPDARITYVAMKPSPSRWSMAARFAEANSMIAGFLKTQPNTGFIDVWKQMLNSENRPDSSLFMPDMLHMNKKGYAIWQKLIEPELLNSRDTAMDRFVSGLIKTMTLDEKIGQLNLITGGWTATGPEMPKDNQDLIRNGKVGGILNAFSVDYMAQVQKLAVNETRLGIPLISGLDVVHGFRTIFPIPLAQSCSWDMAAIEKSERIAATEATAMGVNWTYAPMVDIARDPRWGRVMEGAGEDTYLGSMIAAARVRGFQGSDLSLDNTLMACVKHFAAYGAAQAGRDYNTVDISDRTLLEWYLPPYRAAVDAGSGSLMTSFNEIAGVPSTANGWLLNDLLRKKWGFNGFIVSDWSSITELIVHGVAADTADAARLAINAGVDMDMEGMAYINYLKRLVERGEVPVAAVDEAVRHVLDAKYRLGLFDDPYRYCNKTREENEIMTPGNLAFARHFAASSMVLLKNEKNTLPINNRVRTIAVIGPMADSRDNMLGGWSAAGQSDRCVTLLAAVRERAGSSVKVVYEKGCSINNDKNPDLRNAIAIARKSDFVILALGESQDMSGEASCRTDLSLPGRQMELAKAVLSTGIPAVVVLFNGRPLTIEGIDRIAPAILEAWYGGTEGGYAVADILFGDVNPSGKLTMTFPRNVGQIPLFYNSKNTGRPFDPTKHDDYFKSRYLDSPNTPLYPFGYGLSYSSYSYSPVILNKTSFKTGDMIEASVMITNTGNRDGDEIVQLYIRDMVGDVTRPVKELKGFRKVNIRAGETIAVSFSLPLTELSYYHQDMSFDYDPGEYRLFIGPDSGTSDFAAFIVL